MGDSYDGNQKVGGDVHIFFSRKVTFTYTFQENSFVTFLKGHNVNSSLRN